MNKLVEGLHVCVDSRRKVLGGGLRENIAIGQRRVDRLQHDFESEGYFVVVNSNVNKGVDLLVFDTSTGRLVEAAESTNYARKNEYIKDNRMNRYIASLNAYDVLPNVRKRLYVSFMSNAFNKHVEKQTLRLLLESKIEVVAFGFQD